MGKHLPLFLEGPAADTALRELLACIIESPDGSPLNLNTVSEEELAAILQRKTVCAFTA